MSARNLIPTSIIVFLLSLSAHSYSNEDELDVISYHLTIEPSIEKKHIKGTVIITCKIDPEAKVVVWDAGNLTIDSVSGDHVLGFRKRDKKLVIQLAEREKRESVLTIAYHGHPTWGLLFAVDQGQAYTIYGTSQWMVCNDLPGDKALFYLNIAVPVDKTCIASGELQSQVRKQDKVHYSYQQNFESPSYTYGFAIGNFNQAEETYGEVLLNYFGQGYSSDQLKTIFRETPAVISFFEEKSGVKYDHPTYSQILIGNSYQEMSGFSTLKDTYGELVLQDSTETNLISHELAHQWWGNRVTCKNWNHFWLNEAMATFLSAAYNEYRFGKEKYQSDIDSYYQVYAAIKKRGKDKPLVFDNWSNPSRDDRNIVYFKGAYVLHLLKEKLGEEIFWRAIRGYTTKHFGKSVDTDDFQKAIEEFSGINLEGFFNEWVYKNK